MDTNSDKDKKITGNPERLQDNDHRMDRRTNDAQGEVDYGQNRHQPKEDPEREAESHWKAIESDYRKHYPKLTDTDVNYKAGEFSDVPRRIAKRTNRTPEAVSQEIRGWGTKK